jgi:putative ABC transport system permease protein
MTFYELALSLDMGLIYGLVALGIYIPFRLIDFSDLTGDGSFVLGSVVCGILIQKNVNPWIALVCASGCGALAGVTTGLLHTKLNIADLLSGILVGFILYSINLRIMGNVPNISLVDHTTLFSQFPSVPLWGISLAICVGLSLVLKTNFGLALRSIGQNKSLAQTSGIHTGKMIIIGVALGNSLMALGGALFTQYQGFSDVSSGIGTVVIGLAAVMIGEKIFPSSSVTFRIFMCLAGSVLYRIIISLALHSDVLGLTSSDLNLITGLMVIGITSFPRNNKSRYAKA